MMSLFFDILITERIIKLMIVKSTVKDFNLNAKILCAHSIASMPKTATGIYKYKICSNHFNTFGR